MSTKLQPMDLEAGLNQLEGWHVIQGKVSAIQKEWTFKDFKEAWYFMTHVAELADSFNHHPDWQNVYNHVRITLSTHDADGLTQKDIDLAREIDQIELHANV